MGSRHAFRWLTGLLMVAMLAAVGVWQPSEEQYGHHLAGRSLFDPYAG